MLAKSLKTTGLGGPGRRAGPFGAGVGVVAGPDAACAVGDAGAWVGIGPLLLLPLFGSGIFARIPCVSRDLFMGLSGGKQRIWAHPCPECVKIEASFHGRLSRHPDFDGDRWIICG